MGRKMMAAFGRRLAALLLLATCLPLSAARAAAPPSYYLALGDSVPVWTGPTSYPYLILRHLHPVLPGLQLENLAISGETTTSMLGNGQYEQALAFLTAHRRHVALITIDIGGNDVVGCAFSPATVRPDSECNQRGLATIRRNLPEILRGLRHAAPGVPILGMTYYDPVLGAWLGGPSGRTFAADSLKLLTVLNRELTGLYGGTANTADVQGRFDSFDHRPVSSPWGRVPRDVDRACAWLDISCRAGSASLGGDDPIVRGEAVIAAAFAQRIHPLCVKARAGVLLRPCPGRRRHR